MYATVTLMFIAATFSAIAQTDNQEVDPYPDYLEEVFMDMDFEPNLLTPEVPVALQRKISDYQLRTAKALKGDFSVDMMRNDDVIIVTFPSDALFLPNDTLLNAYAGNTLNQIVPLLKDPYMYKLLVAVHTDDTGSQNYLQNLSIARLNSIYDWLLDAIDGGMIPEALVIIPFSMAYSDPLTDNDTMEHRRLNRRVEFYFIPGPKMIEQAQQGTLK